MYPYEVAVEELKKIVSYSSPLDKLECLGEFYSNSKGAFER